MKDLWVEKYRPNTLNGYVFRDNNQRQQIESWVKENGGTMIRGAAYESVARLWKRAFGVESRYIMVEKKL